MGRVGVVVLVVFFAALVLGQLFGQPTLVAYVESGSMEPTIDAGDGFVAIPAFLAGPPREGDIVTFHAEEIEGGGLTTHRIVGETEDGYITRGDANPFTDQDGGEPPVREDQIAAKALRVGGTAVTIPFLGVAIEGIQAVSVGVVSALLGVIGLDADLSPDTVGTGIFGLGVLLFLASLRPSADGSPDRNLTRSTEEPDSVDARKVAAILLVIVLVPANAAMIVPGGPTEIAIDGDEVAETEEIAPGDPVEAEFDARNGGLITLLLIFDSADGSVTVDPKSPGVPAGETATATVTAPAPEPGVEETITIEEHRYPVVFPESAIVAFHDIHPLLALGAINLFIGGGFIGLVGGLLGFGRVRFRDTSREVPLRIRLKRWLR